MSLIILEVLCIAIFVYAIVRAGNLAERGDLVFLQLHHEYYGIIIFILGLLLWKPLEIIGILVTFDDSMQHLAQWILKDLTIKSPLKLVFYHYWTPKNG